MNNVVPIYRPPLTRIGASGCVSALLGIGSGIVWWSNRNWGWFWAAFGLLVVGAVLSWLGYHHSQSVADRVLSGLGLFMSTIAVGALVVAGIWVLATEDDSGTETPRSRSRFRGKAGRRSRRRRRGCHRRRW